MFSPIWCLIYTPLPLPSLMTSDLGPPNPGPRPLLSPPSPQLGGGLCGLGLRLPGNNQTGPSAVPHQPGIPLHTWPGPGVQAEEAQNRPLATAQLQETVWDEYGGPSWTQPMDRQLVTTEPWAGSWGGGAGPCQRQASRPSTSRVRGAGDRALPNLLPPTC